MWKQIMPGLRIKLFFTLLLGLVYPLAITGLSQVLFHYRANGSLIQERGRVVGSELIGQAFARPEYFQPRPSSAGSGYDAAASGGSNLGPTSAKLLYGTVRTDAGSNEVVDFDGVSLRIVHYCVANNIPYESSVPLERFTDANGKLNDVKLVKAFNDRQSPLLFKARAPLPADAVTASASGLDAHISPANAHFQAGRVARTRGVSVERLNQMISRFTEGPALGLLGEPRVNVLLLNRAMDEQFPAKR